MILAAVRDDAYNVVLLIHIVSFLVAFAPAAINPLLSKHLEKTAPENLPNWAGFTVWYTQKLALPGLGVLLATGIIMIIQSDEVWEFSQTWVSMAFLVWLAIAGVVSGMILKGERQAADGDPAGAALVEKGGKIGTLLLVVMLYLMLFKPGF